MESKIEAVISDFGGVLTTPLVDAFIATQSDTGVTMEELAGGMRELARRNSESPLFELERGRISEREFLSSLESCLVEMLGHPVSLHEFRNSYFKALQPNQRMIDLMGGLKERSYRMAMLTNNVREWEAQWRSMLPIDEIFELVVDSAFVGMRKPEPGIYQLVLERLGGIDARSCLFIDDVEVNCQAAGEIGMTVVQFRETGQAIAEIKSALGIGGPGDKNEARS